MQVYDMGKIKIREYANMLENGETVEFVYNGFFYEIFESADSGYVVNVYLDNEKDEYGNYLDKHIIDGGLCTGSAKDAVEFML